MIRWRDREKQQSASVGSICDRTLSATLSEERQRSAPTCKGEAACGFPACSDKLFKQIERRIADSGIELVVAISRTATAGIAHQGEQTTQNQEQGPPNLPVEAKQEHHRDQRHRDTAKQ